MELNATNIYFAHFDISSRVKENLQLAIDRLQSRDSIVAKAAQKNDFDAAAKEIIALGRAGLEPIKKEMKSLYGYWADISIPMSADGHIRYYKKSRKLS